MSHDAPADPSPVPTWLLFAQATLLVVGVGAVAAHYVGTAPVVPYSDEAGHLQTIWEVGVQQGQASTAGERLFGVLGPRDAYPTLFHASAAALMSWLPGIPGARAAVAAWMLLHVAVAALAGPRLFGLPGTWAYVSLSCLGPVMLSFQSMAFIDGPSATMVGLALLCLLRTEGFSRAGWTFAFALAAVAALYTKWVALLLLAPVVAWQALLAIRGSTSRPVVGLGLGVALVGWAAALAGLVWRVGGDPALVMPIQIPSGFVPVLAAGAALTGLLLTVALVAATRDRPLPPVLLAAIGLLVVVLLAGPWYAASQSFLVQRLDLETAQHAQAVLPPRPLLVVAREVIDLAPALPLVLVPGLLASVRRPALFATACSCLVAAGVSLWAITRGLPPDWRYLLPVVPLVAAGAALGMRRLPRSLAWGLAGLTLLLHLGLSLAPPAPSGKGATAHGGSGIGRRLPAPWPALPVGRLAMPDPLDAKAALALIDGLAQAGATTRTPVLVLESRHQVIQGRAVGAMAAMAGQPFATRDGRWQAPLPQVDDQQLVVAGACGDGPLPLFTVGTRGSDCDLGVYRGVVPDPPAPPPPAGPPLP